MDPFHILIPTKLALRKKPPEEGVDVREEGVDEGLAAKFGGGGQGGGEAGAVQGGQHGVGGITWRVDVGDQFWKSYRGLHYQGETPDGGQWYLAEDGTVVEKADDGWRRHTTADGLIDKVRVVICTRDGRVWAAGSHQGEAATAEFDGTRWLRQSHPGMGKMVDYRSFHEGRNGMLYIGATESGRKQAAVMMLDPRSEPPRWEELGGSARLTNAIDLAEDAGQRLWTGGHTLSVLAPDSTERIAFPGILRGAFIDAVEAGSGRNADQVVARAVATLRPTAEQGGIDLHYETSDPEREGTETSRLSFLP